MMHAMAGTTSYKVWLLAAWIGAAGPALAQSSPKLGPQGPESAPDRRQEWLVPTQDQLTLSHAVLFRPPGKGPFRLAMIAHASVQNSIRRAQSPQPEYRTLAAALVARGFAVLVPERPGHGKTGGPYLEDQGGCEDADYRLSAEATAESLSAARAFMRQQLFVRKDAAVVVGHSAGGWGALALAGESPKEIAAIIVFAPGRGGRANDRAGQVCAPDKLIASAASLGEDAKVPVTWIVADNDSYFSPDLSRQMADAFRGAGSDQVDFQVLPGTSSDGHFFAEAAGSHDFDAMLDRAIRPAIADASKR
jgi:dienelactone hydrolase